MANPVLQPLFEEFLRLESISTGDNTLLVKCWEEQYTVRALGGGADTSDANDCRDPELSPQARNAARELCKLWMGGPGGKHSRSKSAPVRLAYLRRLHAFLRGTGAEPESAADNGDGGGTTPAPAGNPSAPPAGAADTDTQTTMAPSTPAAGPPAAPAASAAPAAAPEKTAASAPESETESGRDMPCVTTGSSASISQPPAPVAKEPDAACAEMFGDLDAYG